MKPQSPHLSRYERAELTQQQTVRLVPRDRIKCCTVFGCVPLIHESHSPEVAQAVAEDDVIKQISREITVALMQYGKVWIQPLKDEGEFRYFFAAVEIIVPEATIGKTDDRHVPPNDPS